MLGLRSALNPTLPSDMTYPRILPAVPNDLCSPGELLLSSIRVPHYRHNEGELYVQVRLAGRLRNKPPAQQTPNGHQRWRMFLARVQRTAATKAAERTLTGDAFCTASDATDALPTAGRR
jgi:hypothetical protein